MRMTTRTEIINGHVYCAYCGKILKDPNIDCCPEPPTICNCEKAKQEMGLYDQLRDLYNAPLAENLIEIKVNEYRNELLGKNKRNHTEVITTLGSVIPCNYNATTDIDDDRVVELSDSHLVKLSTPV